MAAATKSGRALGPVTLDFGSAHITKDSLLVSTEGSSQWDGLIALVREAASRVPGVDGDRYPPPWAPHITIAYATASGDDAEIEAALAATDGAAEALGPVTFTSIAWCAVHQNRDVGTYTFDVLFETPLGGGGSGVTRPG